MTKTKDKEQENGVVVDMCKGYSINTASDNQFSQYKLMNVTP